MLVMNLTLEINNLQNVQWTCFCHAFLPFLAFFTCYVAFWVYQLAAKETGFINNNNEIYQYHQNKQLSNMFHYNFHNSRLFIHQYTTHKYLHTPFVSPNRISKHTL